MSVEPEDIFVNRAQPTVWSNSVSGIVFERGIAVPDDSQW